jgi:hypothetical protein
MGTDLGDHLMAGYCGYDRRCGKDRRNDQRPFLEQLFYRGMREYARRAEDRQRIITFDRYPRPLLTAIIVVLSLSLLDAFLTLILIAQGATELNPVMHYFLGHGPQIFLLVKYGLTVLSVMIIVIAKEPISARYRLSTAILHAFAAFFGGVVIWEFYLLSI